MGMSGGLVTVMKSKANNMIDIHFWWIFWSQIEMILNVCWCWGRSSWWFTLSDISCPLWRASKISHLKFYVARLFANLLNECKITADASGCNLCMLIYVEWLRLMIMEGQSHCRFIMTDGSAVIIVSILSWCPSKRKALVFKRGRGQPKLPGSVLILGTSGRGASCSLPINLGGCAALLQGLVLVFWGSER